jgi:D-lactate dehydrogenase (cytochrome)
MDVCVPLSKLAECIDHTETLFKSENFPCLICAHISDGNYHCMIPYLENEKEKAEHLGMST